VTVAVIEPVCVGATVIAAVAVPVIEMLCGEPGASSVMLMVAERWPAARGEKVTLTLQAEPTLSFGQVEGVRVKSLELGPLRAMAEIFRGTLPELVSAMVCTGLVVPWVMVGKMRLPEVTVIAEVGAKPVPLRGADWGLPGALSDTSRVAWRAPAAVGVKVMLTEQDLPGLMTAGNWQVLVCVKSAGLAPPMEMALTVRA